MIGSDGDGVRDDLERNLVSGHTITGISLGDVTTRDNTVAGNDVGLNAAGNAALANAIGVSITGATRNTIGGTTAGTRNVVTGNTTSGIVLSTNAFNNSVIGNFVGTNSTGTSTIGQTSVGIGIDASSSNDIGGIQPGQGNLISGNSFGVSIIGASANNSVRGNTIGLNLAGNVALPNNEGVHITATAANTIGGNSTAARNLISGNTSYDVTLLSTLQIVQGNWIGIDASGAVGLGPNLARVLVNGGSNNKIGGTAAEAGNVISGNTSGPGVWLTNGANGNFVQGNFLGTNATGTGAISNQQGVTIEVASNNNVIGGNLGSGGNLISGNSIGVNIKNSSSNTVTGNLIGTSASGSTALANTNGVIVEGNSSNNSLGGFTPPLGNVISGNTIDGVALIGASVTNSRILSNKIGTNATGTAALANSGKGINIQDATGTLIGAANAGNVISGNVTGGIDVTTGAGTKVQANFIGTDYTGSYQIANGGLHALRFTNFQGGIIGADGDGVNDELEGNVISGNTGNGIRLQGGSGTFGQHIVAGNIVGLNSTGTAPIANAGIGISILVSEKNRIDSNIVSGNTSYGIDLFDSLTLGRTRENVLVNNVIGTDKLGSRSIPNSLGVQLRSAASNTLTNNLISGNTGPGILVTDTTSANNQFTENTIGLDADGTFAIPNNDGGLVLFAAGTGNIVSSNLISGNRRTTVTGAGIYNSGTDGTVIVSNRIGTNAAGEAAVGNQEHGILVSGTNVRIGTNGDGVNDDQEGNLISGNGLTGIDLGGDGGSLQNTVIAGNKIGTNLTGDRSLGGQTLDGIHVEPIPVKVLSSCVSVRMVMVPVTYSSGTSSVVLPETVYPSWDQMRST